MAKIAMPQVYKRILERHGEEIEGRIAANHQVIGYDFATFKMDMYAGGFISTVDTLRVKWDTMVSDKVLEIPSACKPYTKGILWITNLRAKAEGRSLVRASLPRTARETCVSPCIYIGEADAEGGAQ